MTSAQQKQIIADAFRREVWSQSKDKLIQTISSLNGEPMICPISKDKFYPQVKGSAEVDHYKPEFRDILEMFILNEGVSLELVELGFKSGFGHTLKDRGMAERFRTFHLAYANLRVVSKVAHRYKSRLESKQP